MAVKSDLRNDAVSSLWALSGLKRLGDQPVILTTKEIRKKERSNLPMLDLETMVLRLVSETKGVEKIEEKIAEIAFELGRGILQAVYASLYSKA